MSIRAVSGTLSDNTNSHNSSQDPQITRTLDKRKLSEVARTLLPPSASLRPKGWSESSTLNLQETKRSRKTILSNSQGLGFKVRRAARLQAGTRLRVAAGSVHVNMHHHEKRAKIPDSHHLLRSGWRFKAKHLGSSLGLAHYYKNVR